MSDEPNTEVVSSPDEFKIRTDEELRQLALDIVEGKVFGSWMVPNDEGMTAFRIITMFLGPDDYARMRERKVVGLFEYLDKAGPLSVNGLPSFMSMQLIYQVEVDRLNTYIEQLRVMRAQFFGAEPKPTEG